MAIKKNCFVQLKDYEGHKVVESFILETLVIRGNQWRHQPTGKFTTETHSKFQNATQPLFIATGETNEL